MNRLHRMGSVALAIGCLAGASRAEAPDYKAQTAPQNVAYDGFSGVDLEELKIRISPLTRTSAGFHRLGIIRTRKVASKRALPVAQLRSHRRWRRSSETSGAFPRRSTWSAIAVCVHGYTSPAPRSRKGSR